MIDCPARRLLRSGPGMPDNRCNFPLPIELPLVTRPEYSQHVITDYFRR